MHGLTQPLHQRRADPAGRADNQRPTATVFVIKTHEALHDVQRRQGEASLRRISQFHPERQIHGGKARTEHSGATLQIK